MPEILDTYWPVFVAAANLLVNVVASGHAVMFKRDSRSAIGWAGVIWLVPLLGAFLYWTLGINRVRRKARSLAAKAPVPPTSAAAEPTCPQGLLRRTVGEGHRHLETLARLAEDVTGHPLVPANRITPLVDGDQAYPEMLAAIDAAERSVLLCTYIFDDDAAGGMFCDALARARSRGVAVRVLVDAVGARYSTPPVTRRLRRAGVTVARFLPTLIPWRIKYSNLRNHRKVLVVDGAVGFTGGMNIREGCLRSVRSRHPVRDLHFAVRGPVVSQLLEVAVHDWAFVTGEELGGDAWSPSPVHGGETLSRAIADGPDADLDKLKLVLLGALSCAQSSVTVVTPYFVPDATVITALNVAALRGVDVRIVLPDRSNLALVQWATAALLWQVLERGCRVWLSPPPFDHTKLFLVDDRWALVGSANWDARSLRLNFELDLESYDARLVSALTELVAAKIAASRETTLREVDGRSLPVRLRDGLARLLSPYL